MQREVLYRHRDQQSALEEVDFIHLGKKTSKLRWIETSAKHGDRYCSCIINPADGRAIHYRTDPYQTFQYLYLDHDGSIHCRPFSFRKIEGLREELYDFYRVINIKSLSAIQVLNIRRALVDAVNTYSLFTAKDLSGTDEKEMVEWQERMSWFFSVADFLELAEFADPPCGDLKSGNV